MTNVLKKVVSRNTKVFSKVPGSLTHRTVHSMLIYSESAIPALYNGPFFTPNWTFSKVFSANWADLASLEASEAQILELSICMLSYFTTNVRAPGQIQIPITFMIFKKDIKSLLKIWTAGIFAISVVCTPACICFGTKVHIKEFNNSLLFWISQPKHCSNKA